MSKILPGLHRRAPNSSTSEEPSSNSAKTGPTKQAAKPTDTAQAKTTGTKRTENRARKPDAPKIKTVSAERDGKPIEAEIIPQTSTAGMSIQFDRAVVVVNKRVKWAAAGGILPLPIIDIAAIAAVQLKMLQEISEIYDVPFSKSRSKAIISALIGSVFPWAAGAGLAGLIVKATPVLGWGVGLATISFLAAASTRAIGLVFIQHYEAGGTLTDFDPDTKREHFRREYDKQAQTG